MSPLTLQTGNAGQFTYEEFLKEKVAFDRSFGFHVNPWDLHPVLKPHQAALVQWAIAGGRRAIFARFGLGKSVIQLEILRQITHHRGGAALIVAPLGVRGEFIRDGRDHLGVDVRFIRRTEEIDPDWSGTYVTNYESVRLGLLDVSGFVAVSLDEAAVLRSYGSETTQTFLSLFDQVPFRFVATATPSPNEHLELINYAGFLGVMDRGAALTRFFQRDSTKAGELTLYPHKEREFWLWLNTWACFLQRPSDLGFSDEGYDLPPLEVLWHEVETDIASDLVERDGQGRLFRGGKMSSVESAREKRDTIHDRLAKLMAIVRAHRAAGGEQIVLWCHLNDEQTAIEQALAADGLTFSSVHGGLSDDEAERRLDEWRDRGTYALIGKPMMLGSGLNLQQASDAVFAGVTYKFAETIQSVYRIHRFGQEHPCTVHFIYAETESEVRNVLMAKWQEHDELTERMSDIIRELGLNPLAVSGELTRAMGVERHTEQGADWTLSLNDCVTETRDHMGEDSVDLIVTSIPFGNHYEYSLNYADFGHTDDNDHFWWQMDYASPEFLRVLKPGRIMAVHVKDRIRYGNVYGTGRPTVAPFHAEAIAHYLGHGFDYFGMITVTTDVVAENNQTYRLGYSKMLEDSTAVGVGSPEYILLFGKPQSDRSVGWADERVVKLSRQEQKALPIAEKQMGGESRYSLARWQLDAAADWRSSGDRLLTVDELVELRPEVRSRLFTKQSLESVYDYAEHVRLGEGLLAKNALPSTFASLVPGSWSPFVWHDVNRMLTLNGEQSRRALEFHICPLQFDIVDRLIERFSMPGELVFDPFSGLGTVTLRARRLDRRGYGVELNPTSHRDAVMYQHEEDRKRSIPSLFDLLDAEQSGEAA